MAASYVKRNRFWANRPFIYVIKGSQNLSYFFGRFMNI